MKLIRLDEETGTRIKRSVPKQANIMKRRGSRELTSALLDCEVVLQYKLGNSISLVDY